ncbi:MAG: periplasmic binding protein/LacI transcriptional regulator [Herbinix sp.]|nr:periplasmic binding protein/LacI transcriptional regulator [Herbinix sp.]
MNYRIYLITMDRIDQHWYILNQGAEDMAALLGVTNFIWVAPEVKDNQKQIELLNEAVANGADLIMLAANDPVKISNAIEDAKAKSVLIIYVDSPAYEEAIVTLSTDNYVAGLTAGETMLKQLRADGINSGKIGIIGVNTVTNSTMNREIGFREAIQAAGRYEILPTVYEFGDRLASQVAALKMINENPDLVGLFGTNEGSTIGVGNAIKSSGKHLVGIGFDRSDIILDLVRDGSLHAVLAQNPYTMGYLGMAEAVAALRGLDTGPPMINTGVSIISNR